MAVGRALVLALALAGCLAEPAPTADPEPVATPGWPRFEGACRNALLFQLIDFEDTDAWLPPGFHAADSQDFLDTPAAFGQGGLIVLVLKCGATGDVQFDAASLGIFVHPPVADGVPQEAAFNFYEVERLAAPGLFDGFLQAAAWSTTTAALTISVTPGAIATQAATLSANAADAQGSILSFQGAAGAQVPLNGDTVRFWRDGPVGLAYFEFQATLTPSVGAGTCAARPGSTLSTFLVSGSPLNLFGTSCPAGEPTIATFPALRVNATAHLLAGVHPG
jgi:hypothetical protein